MDYLISLGHTRIAHIQGPDNIVSTRLRCSAYLNALKQHNIPFVKEYLKQGNFQPESGYKATEELLALQVPPSAIFAANDLMAVGVLKACAANMKSAPEHISVMGFDDMEFSKYLIPSLTTLQKSKRKIGSQGANVMVQLMENNSTGHVEIGLDLKLICRDSCIRCI
jgi:LacI family repressor for deo operon, udp, cdd, tsx, nupC, and nupG